MKSGVALALILCLIMAGVAVASYAEYTAQISSQSSSGFTLTVTGHAYHNKPLDVDLSVWGTASGDLKKVVELFVKGGDLDLEGYGSYSVSMGFGILVQSRHYIILGIKITSLYGGQTAVWILRGKTGNIVGKTLPVSFTASLVVLPDDRTLLVNVDLKGTIAATP